MTQPDTEKNPAETQNSISQKSNGRIGIKNRINKFIHRLFGRKPAYRITRNGVEVKYFDLDDTDSLPFDKETYRNTQIFIGKWSNPWFIDIDNIEDEYPNFAEQDITQISDIFSEKYVYPSQRWKLLANQNVLKDMFVGGMMNEQQLKRLMYIVLAGIGFIALLLVFGGS